MWKAWTHIKMVHFFMWVSYINRPNLVKNSAVLTQWAEHSAASVLQVHLHSQTCKLKTLELCRWCWDNKQPERVTWTSKSSMGMCVLLYLPHRGWHSAPAGCPPVESKVWSWTGVGDCSSPPTAAAARPRTAALRAHSARRRSLRGTEAVSGYPAQSAKPCRIYTVRGNRKVSRPTADEREDERGEKKTEINRKSVKLERAQSQHFIFWASSQIIPKHFPITLHHIT